MRPHRRGMRRRPAPVRRTRLLGSRRWLRFGLLVGNGLAQAAAAALTALAVQQAFGQLAIGETSAGSVDPLPLLAVTALLGVATTGQAWLRAAERIMAERLGQSYVHELRLELFDHLTAISPRFLTGATTGSISLRFVGDVSALRRWVSLGLSRLAVSLTMVVGALIALALIRPILALASTVAVIIGAALAVGQGDGLREAERQARRRRSRLAGRVTELVATTVAMQVNGAVGRERSRLQRLSDGLQDAMVVRAGRLGRLTAVAEATTGLATGLVLITGLTIGLPAPEVAAAMAVVALLIPQVRGLARVHQYRQAAQVADGAIDRFLARPTGFHPLPTNDGDADAAPRPVVSVSSVGGSPSPGRGRLELDDVSVGTAVHSVSATIAPGTTVAIVGGNGAGKSTLLALLARLVDPNKGSVRLDGVNVRSLPGDDLRRRVSYAGVDAGLLRGSLRRNLTYRSPDVDDDALHEVVRACGLLPLIGGLPDGLATRIDEGGRNLSTGQRQRVQLARALMGGPDILLLDEADANLDAETTHLVDRLVAARTGTTVLATHRRETAAAADIVWCLDGGRLLAAGPPSELLAPGGAAHAVFAPPARVPDTISA